MPSMRGVLWAVRIPPCGIVLKDYRSVYKRNSVILTNAKDLARERRVPADGAYFFCPGGLIGGAYQATPSDFQTSERSLMIISLVASSIV